MIINSMLKKGEECTFEKNMFTFPMHVFRSFPIFATLGMTISISEISFGLYN